MPLIRQKSKIFATFSPGGRFFVILSDGEAGVEGSVNILKRENGFFDFAAHGRFAQNDTMGMVLLRSE